MRLKNYEWTRHGLTEPLVTAILYKKVEDGKNIAAYRFIYYSNKIIVVFEDNGYRGGEVIKEGEPSEESLAKLIAEFSEDNDDLVIMGEEKIGLKILELLFS